MGQMGLRDVGFKRSILDPLLQSVDFRDMLQAFATAVHRLQTTLLYKKGNNFKFSLYLALNS